MTGPLRRRGQLLTPLLLAATVIVLQWAKREGVGSRPAVVAPALGAPAPTGEGAEGEDADSPIAIPSRGWREILKRTFIQISENQLLAQAAGVTFYGLLAIFPAIAAMVSLYGLIADPKTIADHLDALAGVIPSGGMDIISDQVKRLADNPPEKLGLGAIIGFATALWSANQGSKAFFSALNTVYGEKERRGFFVLTAQSLVFTLGALLFLLLAFAALLAAPFVFASLGIGAQPDRLAALLRWPALLVVTTFFLACLYRFGPSRARPKWRWVTWGSAVASLAWLGLSAGFSWYVANFGSYNKTYGSLGAAIGFMTWIWLSTSVMLIGAQLNAEAERQTGRARADTTEPAMSA